MARHLAEVLERQGKKMDAAEVFEKAGACPAPRIGRADTVRFAFSANQSRWRQGGGRLMLEMLDN